MTTLSFGQIEKLWTDNGGPAAWAPTMAGIAFFEGGNSTTAHNTTPPDNSVGLWQINYYGSLLGPRTAAYGSPDQLLADPNAQARAAISILGGGPGISAWTGDTVGQQAIDNGGPLSLSAVQSILQSHGGSTADGFTPSGTNGQGATGAASDSGASDCVVSFSLPVVGGPCLLTRSNLKALRGGILVASGGILMAVGLVVLVAGAFTKTNTGKAALDALSVVPGGGTVARVARGAGTASRATGGARRSSSSGSSRGGGFSLFGDADDRLAARTERDEQRSARAAGLTVTEQRRERQAMLRDVKKGTSVSGPGRGFERKRTPASQQPGDMPF